MSNSWDGHRFEAVKGWAALLALALLGFGFIFFWVWVAFIADCSSIGWLPITQVPARCL